MSNSFVGFLEILKYQKDILKLSALWKRRRKVKNALCQKKIINSKILSRRQKNIFLASKQERVVQSDFAAKSSSIVRPTQNLQKSHKTVFWSIFYAKKMTS